MNDALHRLARRARTDAENIWHAGVAAVRADGLMNRRVTLDSNRSQLSIVPALVRPSEHPFRLELDPFATVCVVGGGKAVGAMATALEAILGPELARQKQLHGWVNVPEGCQQSTNHIRVFAARPQGWNAPTEAAVAGTRHILDLVSALQPHDLCIVLLSGGGSALLPAPVDGITLADKQAVTAMLSAAGADIRQLNTVRKNLSRIKGGRLLRHCRASTVLGLVISDVLGDPLDVIASGPTTPDISTAEEAGAILRQFDPTGSATPSSVLSYLEQAPVTVEDTTVPFPDVHNFVLANNDTAVQAAARHATDLGYRVVVLPSYPEQPTAEQAALQLWQRLHQETNVGSEPVCLISGGEPTVQLVDAQQRGTGGRNQQLVLATLVQAARDAVEHRPSATGSWAVLSGGTDGEDGPTDAAGAVITSIELEIYLQDELKGESHLRRNDAYPILDQLGALIRVGPTNTNVCDLRVLLHWAQDK